MYKIKIENNNNSKKIEIPVYNNLNNGTWILHESKIVII